VQREGQSQTDRTRGDETRFSRIGLEIGRATGKISLVEMILFFFSVARVRGPEGLK
jgi:hypothetical protein